MRRPTNRPRARAEGITDWQLRHRDIVRSSRDTYLPHEQAADLDSRIAAVLLGAPAEAVVSHRTAADLWGLAIPLIAGDPSVHLTVPPGRRVRQRADRRIHCSVVPSDARSLRRGFCVTSLERTWLDLAGGLPPGALLAVSDQVLRRKVPREALRAALERARGCRGARTARLVLPLADARSGSPMESVLRWLLHEAGLPQPVLQHVVTAGGGKVGTVDLAWPEHRVIVEFDGDGHRDRRVFVDDLRRQNGLVLAGWTVLRFSSADVLGRPVWVVATILRALSAASATDSW